MPSLEPWKNLRLRKDIVTLFDVLCEVQQTPTGPKIIRSFPEDYDDQQVLKAIPQFAMPYDFFDHQGWQHNFGHCRVSPATKTCYVILSGLPWCKFFAEMLDLFSGIRSFATDEDFDLAFCAAYHSEIPLPGTQLSLPKINKLPVAKCIAPELKVFPSMRDETYLLELWNALSPDQLIKLYCSILKERNIIFTGSKLSLITNCVLATTTMLYPMYWQYLLIPVIPPDMKAFLGTPVPAIMGVAKQVVPQVEKAEGTNTAVIIDLDARTIAAIDQDYQAMPTDIKKMLMSYLKKMSMSDGFSEVFYKANSQIFGKFLYGRRADTPSGWDRELFISKHKDSEMRDYLRYLIGDGGVQYLERFCEEYFEKENTLESQKIPFTAEGMPKKPMEKIQDNVSEVFGTFKDKFGKLKIGGGRPGASKFYDEPISNLDNQLFEDSLPERPKEVQSRQPEQQQVVYDLITFGNDDPTPTAETPQTRASFEDPFGIREFETSTFNSHTQPSNARASPSLPSRPPVTFPPSQFPDNPFMQPFPFDAFSGFSARSDSNSLSSAGSSPKLPPRPIHNVQMRGSPFQAGAAARHGMINPGQPMRTNSASPVVPQRPTQRPIADIPSHGGSAPTMNIPLRRPALQSRAPPTTPQPTQNPPTVPGHGWVKFE
ncbi:unnamed protein product, partial [Mesorhabditis spiculigera]